MRELALLGGPPRRLVLSSVALTGAGMIAIYEKGVNPWATWRQALDWGTGSTVLIGPVAAGLAAWQYARMRQDGFAAYASACPRGPIAWLAPAIIVWLQSCAVLVLVTALATGTTVLQGIPSHPGDLPIVLQAAAALAAYAALGGCLGALVAQAWIAPVAAVLGYLLMFFSVWDILPGTFDTGSVTGSLVGNVFDRQVIVLQGVAALGVAAALCFSLLAVLAARRWSATLFLATITAAGAGAFLVLDQSGHERYAYPDTPIALTCAGHGPEVCVARDAPRPLDGLVDEVERQALILQDLGFRLPRRFQVADFFETNPPGVGVITIDGDEVASDDIDPVTVASSLATPGDCPEYSANVPDMTPLEVRITLTFWIADRVGSDRQDPDSELGRWMHSDAGLQWALKVYPKLAACDFTGLDLPPVAMPWSG